jgi:hypothetical protein
MYSYRVVFGRTGVPEIRDLHASYEGDPGPRGTVFTVVFVTGQEVARPPYDHAVGGLCRVIRTDDDGHSEEATGAVITNNPLTVSLDGKGWSYYANVHVRFGAIGDAKRREVLARLETMLPAVYDSLGAIRPARDPRGEPERRRCAHRGKPEAAAAPLATRPQ